MKKRTPSFFKDPQSRHQYIQWIEMASRACTELEAKAIDPALCRKPWGRGSKSHGSEWRGIMEWLKNRAVNQFTIWFSQTRCGRRGKNDDHPKKRFANPDAIRDTLPAFERESYGIDSTFIRDDVG